jgi:hypothetical protein
MLLLSERDDAQASFYRTRGVTSSRNVIVETTTLDEFFAGEGWPSVNVVKVDIEGSEKDALEGMRELIRRNPQLKLIMEFSPSNQSAAGVTGEELFGTLRSAGFKQFSAIQASLWVLAIPQDIRRLATRFRDRHINLLCEQ